MDYRKSLGKPTDMKEDQLKAFDAISKWYKKPGFGVFTLSGFAGTGKTYLVNHVLKQIVNKTVCITAPTHKALKVVEKATGIRGVTVHALHAIRPNVALETFDIDNPGFEPMGQDKFDQYNLIIIDECSMVNSGLHSLNMKRAKEHGTKILYVGDAMQLPPIKERLSNTFRSTDTYQLTQLIRQDDNNPMVVLFKLLRSDIATGGSTFLNYISKNKENVNELGEGYSCMIQNDFVPSILTDFRSEKFKDNVEHIRYGGWTRVITKDWNRFIREEVIGTETIIKVGDLLTGHQTVVDEFFEPILINSEDYIVRQFERRISEDGFMFYRVYADAFSVDTFTGKRRQVYYNIVDHTDPTYERFKRKLFALYANIWNTTQGRPKLWKRYYEFKHMYFTLNTIEVPMSNGSIKYIPNEIDYGYGLTIHKLQGSTLDSIAINLIDICHYGADKNRPIWGAEAIEMRNKLIYTAISRATTNAKLFI